MFRYLALVWDDTLASRRAAAFALSRHLQASPTWSLVLQIGGLQVFVTGADGRSNGVYLLPGDRGAILGRLFRRSGEPPSQATNSSTLLPADEADEILQGKGSALVRRWWGRYVAILRPQGGGTTVLRDPTGTLPCFRYQHDGVSVVFSWLEDLLALPGVPRPSFSWERLAVHMRLGELGGHQTVLDGVSRILPGEALHLRSCEVGSELLWNAVAQARTVHEDDPDRLADLLRDTVRHCARIWAADHERILLRLSGGVDSSILASCLTPEATAAEVLCLNYHSPGSDTDERHYARLAARQARRDLIECERDDGFRLERVLDVALTPTPSTYVGRMAAARRDAELSQRHKAPVLFSGAGGDQLFFEFRTWWPAADYLSQHGVDRGLPAAMMDAARLARLSVWETARLAIREWMHPGQGGDPLAMSLALAQADAFDGLPFQDHVHPVLRGSVGLPIGKLNQTRILLHPIAYYDTYEREAAPEPVNPLLSQPLVELCLQLPTYALIRGGRGRALARRAFAGQLPAEVASRRSKGGLEEHLKTVLDNNIALARSLLLDGQLVAQGLLDRGKVERALSGQPQATTVHVGEIHGHIAVEAWLQRWRATADIDPGG